MRVAVAVFLLIALASATAAAADGEDDVSPFVAKSTAIYLVSGLTTVGVLGFEAEQNLGSHWSFSAGAGYRYGGPQYGAMTHLLLGNARSKFTIGAGLSRGKHERQMFNGDELAEGKSGVVTWANFEVGGEHRWRNGFSIRYFGGYRHVVQGTLVCDAGNAGCPASNDSAGYDGVYTGFGLGFAF